MRSTVFLEKAKNKFENEKIYFSKSFLNNIESEIAYLKKFRLKWFATQLKIFISIGVFENGIVTKEVIRKYSDDLINFAKNKNTGIPRGLQSGIASIAILAVMDVDSSAKEFCTAYSKIRWSAFEIPVIIDLRTKEAFYFKKKPLWGFIYYSFLRELIESNYSFIVETFK